MGLLQRLRPRRASNDPHWEGFVNRPLADPTHNLAAAIRNAHEGKVYPMRSEVPPPERMTRDLAELARFLGAARLGVTATREALLGERSAGHDGHGAEEEDLEALVAAYPYLVVCAVPAEYDPAVAKGMAGQLPVQKSASLCFNLAAYMRELGYRGTVRPLDSAAAAVAAGVGTIGQGGKLSVPGHGTQVYVGDGVLTDLPLALGSPSL